VWRGMCVSLHCFLVQQYTPSHIMSPLLTTYHHSHTQQYPHLHKHLSPQYPHTPHTNISVLTTNIPILATTPSSSRHSPSSISLTVQQRTHPDNNIPILANISVLNIPPPTHTYVCVCVCVVCVCLCPHTTPPSSRYSPRTTRRYRRDIDAWSKSTRTSGSKTLISRVTTEQTSAGSRFTSQTPTATQCFR
jgi:hypothetical protein